MSLPVAPIEIEIACSECGSIVTLRNPTAYELEQPLCRPCAEEVEKRASRYPLSRGDA